MASTADRNKGVARGPLDTAAHGADQRHDGIARDSIRSLLGPAEYAGPAGHQPIVGLCGVDVERGALPVGSGPTDATATATVTGHAAELPKAQLAA